MKRKLFYLVNPISGTKKKAALKSAIQKRNTEEGLSFEISETRIDGDYSYLPGLIRKEKITDIVICGGDGSVSTVTSNLLNTDVAVGIIPTGSGNGLALAAGIPYATNRALDIIIKGHSSLIDGFRINDQFSCMMCGIGNDAQVAHDFALTKVRGLKTYLKISALNYFKSKPYSFTIEMKNKSTMLDAFFITIANSNQFGNHVTIAPRASLNDGLLDIVIVRKMNKMILPFSLLNQISGANKFSELHNLSNNKNIVYFQTNEMVIINKNNAPLHIDGEPQPYTEKIDIKILPNAFRLLQPSL